MSDTEAAVPAAGDTAWPQEEQPRGLASSGKKKRKKRTKKKISASYPGPEDVTIEVVQVDAMEILNCEEFVEYWWASYQNAFRDEHVWLEAKGQQTSRSMNLSSSCMARLVFQDEAGSPLKRSCFIAVRRPADCEPIEREGLALLLRHSSICGFATVDEDVKYSGVCHLRMLLVCSQYHRQGIGTEMLRFIVHSSNFRTRTLGLKFARCHSYDSFYGKIGFQTIGVDELYTYMALRR